MSAMFITMTGALMAPRFSFINPNFAFNPLVSFQVVIMAFLGEITAVVGTGTRRRSPLIILSEGLQPEFPFWFSILLGLVFMVIVYFLPRGVTGLLVDGWAALGRPLEWPRGSAGPLIDAWAWLSRPVALSRAASPGPSRIFGSKSRRARNAGRTLQVEGLTKAFGGLIAVDEDLVVGIPWRSAGTDRSQRLGEDRASEYDRRRDTTRARAPSAWTART